LEHIGKLADNLQSVRVGRRSTQHIAMLAKGEQRLQLMIAILTPLADMQREVELGVGDLFHWASA